MSTKRVETMKLKGNDYAKVASRLKVFWEEHPHGKVSTVHTTRTDGSTEFKAYIWKDKADFLELLKSGATKDIAFMSADAEGTANEKSEKVQNEKGFEKLETIAVGRALALLGYLASGEVASGEEMEAFEEYKQEKAAEARETACKELKKAKTMTELRKTYASLPRDVMLSDEVVACKNECKAKLEKEDGDESHSTPAK